MSAWTDQDERGNYRIRWFDPVAKYKDGTPVKRSQTIRPRCRNETKANEALKAFNATLPPPKPRARVNGPRPAERLTLLQLAMRWFNLHEGHSTRVDYLGAVRRLCRPVEEGGMAIVWPEELTKVGIEEWKQKRSGTGTDRSLAYVRSILNWCHAAKMTPALDEDVSTALAAPQSGRAKVRLLTDAEYQETMAIAEAHGHLAIAHCLSTYGWRPITACRVTVGMVDLAHGRIRGLHRKIINKKSKATEHAHRLLPETCRILAPLVEGREPTEPLFLNNGAPWSCPKGHARQLAQWYRGYCQAVAPDAGGIYAWKRYGIYRMKVGGGPWSPMKRPLTDSEAIEYTGHLNSAMIGLYMRPTDMDALFEDADEKVVIEDADDAEDPDSEPAAVAPRGGSLVAVSGTGPEQDGTQTCHSGPVIIRFEAKWTQLGQVESR